MKMKALNLNAVLVAAIKPAIFFIGRNLNLLKFWFPYFRLHAPTEAYFDHSWPLPDIEKLK